MVQVLPALPTFGEKLADSLSGAASNYFQGQREKRINDKDQKLIEALQDPNLTPMGRISLYGQLSQKRMATLSPVLAAFEKSQTQQEKNKQIADYIKKQEMQGQGGQHQQGEGGPEASPLNQFIGALSAAQAGGGGVGQQQGQPPISGMENVGAEMQQQGGPSQRRPVTKRPIPSPQDILEAYAVHPDLGRAKQSERDVGLRQETEERKIQQEEEKKDLENKKFEETKRYHQQAEKIQVHDLSKDSAKQLREDEKRAENTLTAVKSVRNSLKKTKTGALTWQNFFKKQFKGTFLENLPLSPEGAIIEANIPAFIEGKKELFGQRLSDADLAVVLGKTIDLGKSNEANEAILNLAEFTAELSLNKAKIANEIVKENGGYRPIDFDRQVDERYQERYGQAIDDNFRKNFGPKSTDVHMIAPDGGDLYVPIEEVDKYLKLEAKII